MPGVIVVASVPKEHVYVRHLTFPGDGVMRIAEPGLRSPAVVMISPGWVDANQSRFDVFHIHFRFGAVALTDLQGCIDELRRKRKPLIFTVHDLENPQAFDQRHHLDQLDRLMRCADALVTLSQHAADLIYSTWGRTATVIPHPHVVPIGEMLKQGLLRRGGASRPYLIGLHLKSLRPGVEPVRMVEHLAAFITDRPLMHLRVDLNADGLDKAREQCPELIPLLARLRDSAFVTVRIHARFSDKDLWRYLSGLETSVLPYRLGTHSGWAEACLDLGVGVAAPRSSCIPSQHPSVLTYDLADPSSLDAEIDRHFLDSDRFRYSASGRLSQRRRIAFQYRAVYQRALARLT